MAMHVKGRATYRQQMCLRAFMLGVDNPESDEIVK